MAAPTIPPGTTGLTGLDAPGDSWQTRLKEAAYTSPSGNRIVFAYEALSREFDKRTAEFSFAGVDDSYVQENGYTSRRYPMRCIFSGANCDRQATAFEAALLETGVGKLEHPVYGAIDCLPYGTVKRSDDPLTEGNQSVVDVTFWTTTGAVYPQSQSHPQSEILAALDGFDQAAAQSFEQATSLDSEVEKVSAKATVRKMLREATAALEPISNKVTAVNNEFRDLNSIANQSLDVTIGNPLQLALQVTNLLRAPGRAASGLADRLDGYKRLGANIMASAAGTPALKLAAGTSLTARTTGIANDFHISDLFATSAVAAVVASMVVDPVANDGEEATQQFTSRQDALTAAEAVLQQYDEVVAWRDQGFADLGGVEELGAYQVDTGGAYQALQTATALCAGFLISLSFSLADERFIELENDTTIINMAAQLYGQVDERLDFLINTNELTGSEILELPRGSRLVYYPP
jgi:prophage DNA circulation protein